MSYRIDSGGWGYILLHFKCGCKTKFYENGYSEIGSMICKIHRVRISAFMSKVSKDRNEIVRPSIGVN